MKEEEVAAADETSEDEKKEIREMSGRGCLASRRTRLHIKIARLMKKRR